jgi:hypothetical protein
MHYSNHAFSPHSPFVFIVSCLFIFGRCPEMVGKMCVDRFPLDYKEVSPAGLIFTSLSLPNSFPQLLPPE